MRKMSCCKSYTSCKGEELVGATDRDCPEIVLFYNFLIDLTEDKNED